MKTRIMAVMAALCLTMAGGAHADLIDNKDGSITDTAQGLVWLNPSQLTAGETVLAIANTLVRSDACEAATFVVETVAYGTMLIYEGYNKDKCGYVWIEPLFLIKEML